MRKSSAASPKVHAKCFHAFSGGQVPTFQLLFSAPLLHSRGGASPLLPLLLLLPLRALALRLGRRLLLLFALALGTGRSLGRAALRLLGALLHGGNGGGSNGLRMQRSAALSAPGHQAKRILPPGTAALLLRSRDGEAG
jgi:hypothetical protein